MLTKKKERKEFNEKSNRKTQVTKIHSTRVKKINKEYIMETMNIEECTNKKNTERSGEGGRKSNEKKRSKQGGLKTK